MSARTDDAGHYWRCGAGARQFKIYRMTGGATQGLIGTRTFVRLDDTAPDPQGLVFDDTGLPGDGSTPPTVNRSADSSFGRAIALGGVTHANLGSPANGTLIYCSDCTVANPCASGGTGALAKRLNGAWVCN